MASPPSADDVAASVAAPELVGGVAAANPSPGLGGDDGAVEAFVHCRRGDLAVAQLFANTLEHKHVGIHAHADRQDHTSYTRQREYSGGKRHEANQDH